MQIEFPKALLALKIEGTEVVLSVGVVVSVKGIKAANTFEKVWKMQSGFCVSVAQYLNALGQHHLSGHVTGAWDRLAEAVI